jgi:enoyl-CoA hydratase/carnithine racemase
MDERTANSIIQRLEPIYGVSALRFELEATKQAIGEVFMREVQKAIASWKRQRDNRAAVLPGD